MQAPREGGKKGHLGLFQPKQLFKFYCSPRYCSPYVSSSAQLPPRCLKSFQERYCQNSTHGETPSKNPHDIPSNRYRSYKHNKSGCCQDKIKFCLSSKWAATDHPTLLQEPPSEGAGASGRITQSGSRPSRGTHTPEHKMSSDHENEARQ